MKIAMLLSFCLLLVAGCAPVKESQNVQAETVKGGFLGLSKASDIDLSGEKAVKGETRAVVPYFKIGFYTEDNPAGYKCRSGSCNVKIRSTLKGVDNSVLQRITDTAYKNFTAQMKAKGIEVLPISTLTKSATYNSKFSPGAPYKAEALFGPDAVHVSPTGMRMSSANFTKIAEVGNVLKELNASVVEVQLYVTYLSQQLESTLRVVHGISVGQTTTVIPGSNMKFYGLEASKCVGYCPNTVATAKLGQPVFKAQTVGELRESSTAGDKAADIAVSALSILGGRGLKTQNTKRYELHADPKKYESVATAVLKEATEKLVNAITTQK